MRRRFRATRVDRNTWGTLTALAASAAVKAGPEVPAEPGTGEGGYSRKWQREAWNYYDAVGELHYAGSFVGSCLSRIRLMIGIPDEEGNASPAFDDEGEPKHPHAPEALAALRDLRAQIGGQSALMRAFGINLFIAGEGYLVGTDEDGARQWEVLSVEECGLARNAPAPIMGEAKKARYERKAEPSATPTLLPAESYVVRVWKSHPRWSYLADAPTIAVRDILEELQLLTREVRGQALSRLASAGVWIVPEEIDYVDTNPDATEGDDDDGDALTRDLIRTMSTAIADKGSAASTVPFVFRPPYDYCDRIRFEKFSREFDTQSVEKRAEAILRFARGIDLPVEVVLGHANTTFSNAWQIDEALYKTHIEPVAETVYDCLTIGYLRTVIPETPLVIMGDASELVAHPDRSRDAAAGHTAMVISDDAYRRTIGFTKADAPDADELARRIEIARATKGQPALAGVDGGPGAGQATSGVAAAVEVSALRAVQRAGARIRSKANGNPSVREIIRATPDDEVAAVLGPARVAQIMGDEELFKNEFVALRRWAAGQVGAGEADTAVGEAEDQARSLLYRPKELAR